MIDRFLPRSIGRRREWFALGGGQALHAHGLGERLSLDLDFYVTRFDQNLFDRAETATLAALRHPGYQAEVGHSDTWLRQILVTDPHSGDQAVLDLGQDYRQHLPVVIVGIGPVIDLPAAAASKARALNDRRAARDYLDIHALLTQTGWTPARLFAALRDNLRPVARARPRSGRLDASCRDVLSQGSILGAVETCLTSDEGRPQMLRVQLPASGVPQGLAAG